MMFFLTRKTNYKCYHFEYFCHPKNFKNYRILTAPKSGIIREISNKQITEDV
jgi:hypothetical protein